MPAFDRATVRLYTESGAWDADSLGDLVRRHAASQPDGPAFLAPDARLTWREYDEWADRLAAALVGSGFAPGAKVGVFLPDGALVHAVFLAAERAGVVFVGIGPRSGDGEIAHLLRLSGAEGLITAPVHRGRDTRSLFAALAGQLPALHRHVEVSVIDGEPRLIVDGSEVALPSAATAAALTEGRGLGPNDLFCLNSTSGTTGMPKLVMQTMNIWKYFTGFAAEAGEFRSRETFMSLLPAPFGFGLWTGHVVPTVLGHGTVVLEEFDVEEAFAAIERERVTVIGAVSTQFIMMLNSQALSRYDLSSLRVMFTGGERVPYERAAEFEERTGCAVLQFYGSNEAGPISVTRISDSRERRLQTSGRIIAEMQPRLFSGEGLDITDSGGPGQCACKGPGLTPGYYNDEEANAGLFREDGWLVTGDLAEIDADGYLTVVGRASDFIIRGGHNISAVAVEDELASHPRVALVAAVGMPDPVLGERVCAYVVLRDGGGLELDDVRAHLQGRGTSKHVWPERVIVVPELPLAPGGKVRKADLREDIARRLSAETAVGV
jgi:acyl-CoA synthetase